MDAFNRKPVLTKSQLDRIANKTKKESQIENLVCEAAVAAKWTPLKFFSSFSTGWPDRIFLTPGGVTIWCEFKKPGGTYKRLQELNRDWLIRNDHAYYAIHDEERAKWFIKTIIPMVAKLVG
jgi:hypothetical protein